jgi:hypothetical protein
VALRALRLSALLTVACAAGPARPPSHEFAQDWLLVYWLPYDNDLASAAPEVLGALERADAPGGGRVEVVAQVDVPGDAGMTRVRIGPGGREDTLLDGHDGSSRIEELASLLDWVARSTDARRVMIALLGHAGRLEELSPDRGASPFGDLDASSGAPTWMRLEELAPVLEGFRARLRGEVELLVLQSCAKASVEVAYELRRAARFLLGSQALLGAPNHYYGGAIAALRAVPSTDGAGLAEVIAASERPDMFVDLSLVDLGLLDVLPGLVDAAAAESSDPIPATELETRVFLHGGDVFVDAHALLEARRLRAAVLPRALDALSSFLAEDALVWHRTSPSPDEDATFALPVDGAPSGLWLRIGVLGDDPAGSPFALVRDSRLFDLVTAAPP